MSESQAAASLSSGEFSFISDPSRVGAEAEAPEAQQAASCRQQTLYRAYTNSVNSEGTLMEKNIKVLNKLEFGFFFVKPLVGKPMCR